MRALRGPTTAVAAALVGVGMSGVLVTPAQAADDGIRFTDVDITYAVTRDGGVDVTERYDVRYSTPHHGMYRTLVTGKGYSADQHRLYPLSAVRVTSPTGAPAAVSSSRKGGATQLRIGSADRTVTGFQQYTISYHLDAVVNKQSNASTEFYWNVFDAAMNTPMNRVHVTVKGPGAVNRAICFYGATGSKNQCTAHPGETATYEASNIGAGEGLTIAADLPTSGFANTAPILADGSAEDAFGDNGPLSSTERSAANIGGGVLAAGMAGAGGWWLLRSRRRDGDERFAGLPPGQLPAPGETPGIIKGSEPQVAVRFEPPADATPGLVGLILDRRADNRDVAGTIVDLARRGYLRMEQIERKDWLLSALSPPAQDVLLSYEADLLNALFADGGQVRLSDLKNRFASHLAAAQSGLERESMTRGWFRETPSQSRAARSLITSLFGLLTLPAYILAERLHLNGFVFAAGFAALALLSRIRSNSSGARTAVGSAMYDQARGFELYLSTAEAKQFRFEEAEQIFSRYMPYAVVFGVAERWAKVFGEVAAAAQAQGYAMSMPHWYVSQGGFGGPGDIGGMGAGLDSFGEVAASTLGSTPGSSGGSGFGGGGSSGSGGGGGSAGGW